MNQNDLIKALRSMDKPDMSYGYDGPYKWCSEEIARDAIDEIYRLSAQVESLKKEKRDIKTPGVPWSHFEDNIKKHPIAIKYFERAREECFRSNNQSLNTMFWVSFEWMCEEIQDNREYIDDMWKDIAKYREAEQEGRLVTLMPQSEFDNRLEKLRSENWKVNSLCRDCGGVPDHLKDKLYALLEVKEAPKGYVDTREEAATALERSVSE